MIEIMLGLGLFITSVIEIPRVVINWHVVPKQACVLVLGVLSLAFMLLPNTTLFANLGPAQILALGWGIWCVVSCSWSVNAPFSFRTSAMQLSLVLIFLLLSSNYVNIETIAIFGALGLLVNVLLSIYQHFHGDPWIPTKKSRCGFGTMGNRNWYAAYAVGAIAFPVYLALVQHWAWWYLVALTIVSLILARSKSSILALTMGLAAIPVVLSKRLRQKLHTFRYRLHYWRAGLFLLRERPWLGYGMRQFRREVYRANMKLNELTKGKFLNPKFYENPKPRETHNDYLGFAVDCGLIGLVLFLGATTMALLSTTSLVLAFGVLAILLNAMVFYPLRAPASALVFWVLLGLLAHKSTLTIYTLDVFTSIILFGLVATPILVLAYKLVASTYWANQGYKTGDGRNFDKALELDPNNSTYLMSLLPAIMNQDPISAAHCCGRMIEHFDGDTIPWAIWELYGVARMRTGSIPEAQKAFEMALQPMPYYKPAKKGLRQCNEVLKQGGVQIQFKPLKESPNG